MMEYDIHTLLDFMTLFATLWVIYTLRFPLKASYQAEQDSVYSYYVVCARNPQWLSSSGKLPKIVLGVFLFRFSLGGVRVHWGVCYSLLHQGFGWGLRTRAVPRARPGGLSQLAELLGVPDK